MTIYVSELPKSCRECFCNIEDTWCALSDGEMGDICKECDNKTRHKKCPLQSLADYTKQVRKEVCDEIRDFVKIHKETIVGDYNYQTCDFNETDVCGVYFINQLLDQI